jgi:hypothetical protein
MISTSGLNNIRDSLPTVIGSSPLLIELNQCVNHSKPDAALKSWLKQYQRAQPQDKALLADVARRVALELIDIR